MQYLPGLLLFVLGCFVGLKFADFDQTFYWQPLIVHRSLLTHGLLVPLLLFMVLRKQVSLPLRFLVMGFCLASAVHLSFDLFPRSWWRFSLIHVPLSGWTSTAFSIVWMLVSILVCLYLACRLIGNTRDFFIALGGLVATYGVSAAHEPYPSFFAFVVLVIAAFIAFVLPRPHSDKDKPPFDMRPPQYQD